MLSITLIKKTLTSNNILKYILSIFSFPFIKIKIYSILFFKGFVHRQRNSHSLTTVIHFFNTYIANISLDNIPGIKSSQFKPLSVGA